MCAKAIIGSDDWLFLDNDSNSVIDQVTGRYRLNDDHIARWTDILAERDRRIVALTPHYTSVLVRNKEYVYRDFLPPDIVHTDNGVFEQFRNLVDRRGLSCRLVVSSPDPAKFRQHVFSKVDTHWTADGAIASFYQVLAALRSQGAEISVRDADQFEIAADEVPGDLGSKCEPPRTGIQSRIVHHPKTVTLYANGVQNIGSITINQNDEAPNDRVLVLCGNSFSEGSYLRLFSQVFRRVYFFFCPNVPFDIIEKLSPDFVVIQLLERFLPWVPSDDNGLSVVDHSAMKILSGHQQKPFIREDPSLLREITLPATTPEGSSAHIVAGLDRILGLAQSERRQFLHWLKGQPEFQEELCAAAPAATRARLEEALKG